VKGSLSKVRKWGVEQEGLSYAAGAMILDADDPSKVLARTSEPIWLRRRRTRPPGRVANVVFPTRSRTSTGCDTSSYGMADSRIGVARLDRRA